MAKIVTNICAMVIQMYQHLVNVTKSDKSLYAQLVLEILKSFLNTFARECSYHTIMVHLCFEEQKQVHATLDWQYISHFSNMSTM